MAGRPIEKIRRMDQERQQVVKMQAFERHFYYGPAESVLGEIPGYLVSLYDYVRVDGAWSKVGKLNEGSLVTFLGKTVQFSSPPEDFLIKKPNAAAGLVWALVIGMVANGLAVGGIIASIYLGLWPRDASEAHWLANKPPSAAVLRP